MTSREVPKQARPPPEGRNLKSKSELCFPVWGAYGPKPETIQKSSPSIPRKK